MNQENSDPAGNTREPGTLVESIADEIALAEILSSSLFDRRLLANLLFLLIERGLLENDEVRKLISTTAARTIETLEQKSSESESSDTEFVERMVKTTEKMSTDLLNRFDP